MKKKTGFVLGDHQFLPANTQGSFERWEEPKRQILGALPPTYLEGMVKESTSKSPTAKDLYKGVFCGHGEPTMTIFDIIIDDVDTLEIGAILDWETEELKRNPAVVAVRKPNGSWYALFRREWEDEKGGLVKFTSPKIPAAEAKILDEIIMTGARISIGFEYPCDADSRDAVSWLTIDILEKGKKKIKCIVDAEMA